MMKIIFYAVIVALAFSAFGEAAIARADFSNPSYPGKCVLDYNTIMSPGQTGKAPNNPCAGVTCMEHGIIEFKTCPAVPMGKGCKLRDFVNTNRPYPSCCERHYDCTEQI